MKRYLFASILGLFILPLLVSAHGTGMMGFDENGDGFDMMRYVEDQAVGDEVHEEMEDLMVKMMTGDLTQEESQRIVELMDEYPGVGGMMSSRMMGAMWGGDYHNVPGNWGYGWPSLFSVLCVAFVLVWTVTGIVLTLWLLKKMSK